MQFNNTFPVADFYKASKNPLSFKKIRAQLFEVRESSHFAIHQTQKLLLKVQALA